MSPEVRVLAAASLVPAVQVAGCSHEMTLQRALAWADELIAMVEPKEHEQVESAETE